MNYHDATRKWRVLIELSDNKTSYDMVTMKEVTRFARMERRKASVTGNKTRPFIPVEPWLLDIIFSRFKVAFASLEIVSVEIQPLLGA
jgi:hypothetical protein